VRDALVWQQAPLRVVTWAGSPCHFKAVCVPSVIRFPFWPTSTISYRSCLHRLVRLRPVRFCFPDFIEIKGDNFRKRGGAFGKKGGTFGGKGGTFGEKGGTFEEKGGTFGEKGGTFKAKGGTFGAKGGPFEAKENDFEANLS
jgi:hypothetical protein